MHWSNVRTVFRRELIDQLRDRRTLFMILGLPLLLYPILGIGMASLATAFEQKPRTVVVLGASHLPKSPALLAENRESFRPELFEPPTPEEASRLKVVAVEEGSGWESPAKREAALRSGMADAVVIVPPDVSQKLETTASARLPVIYNSADEQSQLCAVRVRDVLSRWREAIVLKRLEADRKPESYIEPVRVEGKDVARPQEAGGSVWARIFPFLLVMMALTGAFYPAIDLCAGEKERGTMETLLISPASRVEIVVGKFLTVMVASVATAVLNLVCLGLTGWQLARQFGAMGASSRVSMRMGAALSPPSAISMVWMFLLLIPLAMLFSALCLALAVLARSMKEGQYYMSPLFLVAMPLMCMTLVPGIELTPFTCLVPITGAELLLRALMQGRYDLASQYSLPVLVPTVVYAVLALRWAVDQFENEAVLFREAERFHLADYLRHLIRDREPRPGPGMVVLCFATMLVSAVYLGSVFGSSPFALAMGQLAFILGPPVLFAFVLTSDPIGTLRLRGARWADLALGVGLAVALNPLVAELRPLVNRMFPVPKAVEEALKGMMGKIPNIPIALLLLAVVPAICEEVAFRGFILSGLRTRYRAWSAIVLSALLFGLLHVLLSLFQQLFNATLLGLVLGLLALKTRSLWPGVLFHATNNGLAVLMAALPTMRGTRGLVRALYRNADESQYHVAWVMAGAIAATAGIVYLVRRPAGERAEAGGWR